MNPPAAIMQAFPKPKDVEGKETLTSAERRKKKIELFREQSGLCANPKCFRAMTLEPGYFYSAELDHIEPEPAGCAKRDNDDNLQLLCHECNREKGSKRI